MGAIPCGATARVMPDVPTPKVMLTDGHVPVSDVVRETVPPGVTWRERQLRDPGQAKRDAAWTPSSDLPLVD